MQQKILILILMALIVGATIFVSTRNTAQAPVAPTPSPSTSNNKDDVESFVMEFGTKLRMVPLLASTEERTAAMTAHYSRYVAPQLLSKWFPEGSEALGRYASNPWPESIDVVEVREDNGYTIVEANVIEVTTDEPRTPAAVYPVTLTLENRKGNWFIVNAVKGAYSEIPHRQTLVGYWECLPLKDPQAEHTLECALGIAIDQSDGHFAVDTVLMSQYPVDFPMGTKVRVSGVVTPSTHLSSIQKYDIDGIISATEITKVE